ncbi:MAG: nitroreductase family protein, partial [Alphaproteobacteria bacterium]
EKQSRFNSFDTGAAWAELALQATSLGYQAHAMAGINFERSRQDLIVPERFRVEIAIAIGTRADPSMLPDELQSREQPSLRLPFREIVFAGSFPH